MNVALYGPRATRWAMTERKRPAVARDRRVLSIGRSQLEWKRDGLTISIDEVAAPWPRRLRGTVRVEPTGVNAREFELAARGGHLWRPIAPRARVSVDLDAPASRWSGDGYFDMNVGNEPLEDGFIDWTWSRAALGAGAGVIYDARPREGGPVSMALRFNRDAEFEMAPLPPPAALPRSRWRVPRATRADDGIASISKSFEDTPFYARSLVSGKLFGENVASMHESLALDRFAHPLVKLMLPFRMPRR